MADLRTIEVPDIGDFNDVEIIDLLISEGDRIELEQSLLTVESDKASMDIPASLAGTITSVQVQVGDKVSAGSVICVVEVSESSAPTSPASQSPAPTTHTATDQHCQLLVIGAGPGGYSAAFRAADLGVETVLLERNDTLGGVCLNVGCIPSKALLHIAAVIDETAHLGVAGVEFAAPKIDLDGLRDYKNSVIGKLTGGLAGMAKQRKVSVLQGTGSFNGPNSVAVTLSDGSQKNVGFDFCIIAAGSESVNLPFLPDDPRIVDSTGALELPAIPSRMLVIGGGIIGLELGSVYATLGSEVDIVEMTDSLMPGADTDLVKAWQKHNASRFNRVMLNTRTSAATIEDTGIRVSFDGENAPAQDIVYDFVLQAVGRRPNGAMLAVEQAGLHVSDRGFLDVNAQMRTSQLNIFAIGDIVGQPMLAHKAVHEGHVAAEVIAGELLSDEKLKAATFDPLQIPSVAYTDPEVAWAGKTEAELKASGTPFEKGLFPFAASGRAIANNRTEGFTKLLFDSESGRLIGGGIVGTGAGDYIGEVCLAIEMGADAVDIGKTIHPHPTLGESIGLAAEVAHGVCTDLPPKRR